MTASILFAGKNYHPGPCRCYYCGAPCSSDHLTADYVKDTFTNRDIVKFPGSAHVCSGCAESLGQGADELAMIDGTTKHRENSRGMQPRMYSWVLTSSSRLAATKAHIRHLREAVLNPPEPPFSIILADSGQKQLIFRAPVAMSREEFPVMLEDSEILVRPELLVERLALAGLRLPRRRQVETRPLANTFPRGINRRRYGPHRMGARILPRHPGENPKKITYLLILQAITANLAYPNNPAKIVKLFDYLVDKT